MKTMFAPGKFKDDLLWYHVNRLRSTFLGHGDLHSFAGIDTSHVYLGMRKSTF